MRMWIFWGQYGIGHGMLLILMLLLWIVLMLGGKRCWRKWSEVVWLRHGMCRRYSRIQSHGVLRIDIGMIRSE